VQRCSVRAPPTPYRLPQASFLAGLPARCGCMLRGPRRRATLHRLGKGVGGRHRVMQGEAHHQLRPCLLLSLAADMAEHAAMRPA
jgi:hypothetical protein